ncbi:TIGR00341 family protein [Natrialbaceae archaeon A-gly3]
MRLLRLTIEREELEAARETLESQDFRVVVTPTETDGVVVLETPLPANAVEDALEGLDEVGVTTNEFTVVGTAATAMTETSDVLEERYAGEYRPLTGPELRTKARDLSRDPSSYAALMILSALIATAGLLVDSPAIVVGSMVIAPIIGPGLTASVGYVTRDRQMIADSLWMQLYGLGLAIVAGAVLAGTLRVGGFVPANLDLPTLDLLGVRVAPNALSLVVGLAAGAAGGIGLTTKGPTSIIGVMIAAALIPTAAATGIAIAWLEPALAIGTAVLLIVTMVAINVAVLAVLVGLGYRSRERANRNRDVDWSLPAVAVLAVVIFVLTLTVVSATAGQVVVDRDVAGSVDDTLEDPAYENLTAVSVQTEYADMSPFTGPRGVSIVVAEEGNADTEAFAEDVADRISERTDESVEVRVQTIEYEPASTASENERVAANPPAYSSNGSFGS